ncbi:AAA family ATPase [Paenibacillus qinlingensis]|uniref:Kinase n=1 Tax=Paenibacillus qinlingensis TaxID=1837343 RepID=A0ABU1NZW0_9BACL|nr:AAA family ATPase [Paenibacillus qinlingensis]MDR6552621.1 putative kinase [Paenibacillus qinlingensis]
MPKIILFRGRAGTGKSTFSNDLAKRINVPVLHKDDIYDSVAGFVAEHGSRNKICFDLLYRFLETVIHSNATIILDYGLNNIVDVRQLEIWITERGGELIIIHCICSDEPTWSERLASRSISPLPNQLITNLSDLKEHYKDLDLEYVEGELILDTVLPKNVNVEKIQSFLFKLGFVYDNK